MVLAAGLPASSADAAGPLPLMVTLHADELAGLPLMGLGVQWDPYDSFRPTPTD